MLSSQKSILNYYQNSEKQYLTILYVMVRDEDEINVRKQLFELLHAVEKGQYLELTPNLFSRKLLKYLYDIGAFQATQWNEQQPYKDYQFMPDMFNKRTRATGQNKKVTAILLNSIKLFLQQYLENKVRNYTPRK